MKENRNKKMRSERNIVKIKRNGGKKRAKKR